MHQKLPFVLIPCSLIFRYFPLTRTLSNLGKGLKRKYSTVLNSCTLRLAPGNTTTNAFLDQRLLMEANFGFGLRAQMRTPAADNFRFMCHNSQGGEVALPISRHWIWQADQALVVSHKGKFRVSIPLALNNRSCRITSTGVSGHTCVLRRLEPRRQTMTAHANTYAQNTLYSYRRISSFIWDLFTKPLQEDFCLISHSTNSEENKRSWSHFQLENTTLYFCFFSLLKRCVERW